MRGRSEAARGEVWFGERAFSKLSIRNQHASKQTVVINQIQIKIKQKCHKSFVVLEKSSQWLSINCAIKLDQKISIVEVRKKGEISSK